MRILFSFVGANGHLDPLLPLARAAEAAGHTVAFTGQATMAPAVEAAGFTAFPSGPDLGGSKAPLLALDNEREARAVREGFAGRIARARAADLIELGDRWRPDLLVCDEMDFGALLAAEVLGLPYASVLVIVEGSFVWPELIAGPLNALRAEHGLAPDPELEMLSRHLVLAPLPPSFRDPGSPLPATARPLRPGPPALAPVAHPVPRIYVTLGTVFNLESGDLFQRVLAGLRDLPVEVVVTVGRQLDPAELGPQPANVRIERFVPQAELLPACDLVVSHGGSGSVLGALAHGLPMVLIPMGADQPQNAARCEKLGVARVLDPVAATPASIREAVTAVLADPSYREAAGRLRAEIAALPGPEYAVTLLEGLVP